MTAYNSNQYTPNTISPRVLPDGYGVSKLASYALTTALATNDTIKMCDVPGAIDPAIGVYTLGCQLDMPSLDSGGTPTIVLDVGTSGSSGLFISSCTVGQGGGVVRNGNSGAASTSATSGTLGVNWTVTNSVQIKVRSGPQTGASSGTIWLETRYTYDP